MASPDRAGGRIGLGPASVALACPPDLLPWFPNLLAAGAPAAGQGVEVLSLAGGGFAVSAGGVHVRSLALGDALAQAWERIAFQLCDGLTGAAAIHGAALSRGGGLVLLPGTSGIGKTRLALWYRRHGFALGTDELATLAVAAEALRTVSVSALGRPVIVKGDVDLAGLLRPGEADTVAVADSAAGRLLGLDPGWSRIDPEQILVVFPRFSAGAPLSLRPLSPAEAALRLLGSCVNLRNLPRGGLPLAAAVARSAVALALDYGDSGQLDGTLDVLTDRVLAGPVERGELADLCAALEARSLQAAKGAGRAAAEAPPAPAILQPPRRLTVGMATYDDYDGAYFTIQALRTYHPELRDAVEFVIVDNNPDGVCAEPLRRLAEAVDHGRYVARGEWSGTAVKNAVFEEAGSPCVVCLDSHVLLAPGSLAALLALLESGDHRRDLVQGPLIHDDLRAIQTHMDPVWSGGMYGVWGNDPRGADAAGPAFDIPIQGMGVFACRRDAWAGFNPRFRGFGGEEFYIHEKTRQRGGRTLCLPRLRWMHRFNRPLGVPYPNRWEDRMRNYLIGFYELGVDTGEMEAHFAELLGREVAAGIFAGIRKDLATSPA